MTQKPSSHAITPPPEPEPPPPRGAITSPPQPEDPPPKPSAAEERYAELLALIAPHAKPGESAADVLRRLLPSRTG